MRIDGRRYRDEWIPNYYPSRQVAQDQWIRLSRSGKTIVLSKEDDQQLHELFMRTDLFSRLERAGHIVTPANACQVFEQLREWQGPVYAGPALHIVVLTTRCNLNCVYCHMNPQPVGSNRAQTDLQPETAREIVRFALESPNASIAFEFQGGEPFLNFGGMRHFVEEAKRRNRQAGKDLSFSVVTNLMLATDDQLRYCQDEGIGVSYTLNGPQQIHDSYRMTRRGTGSFLRVMDRSQDVQAKFPGLVSPTPLCVIDQDNAGRLREMIDFYFDAGFAGMAIVRLKHMGNARRNELQLDMRRYLEHYIDGLNYILEKNRGSGRAFRERMIPIALAKIFGDSNVNFVDWRNPCGDVAAAITYDVDGEILPADEARSLREEFALGNVRNLSYTEFVRGERTFRTANLSLRDRDPECRECPYNPFCGVMPVMEFAKTGSAVPRPYESDECLFTLAVLDWTFKQLLTDPIPLVRMLPDGDTLLGNMLSPQPEGLSAYHEPHGPVEQNESGDRSPSSAPSRLPALPETA